MWEHKIFNRVMDNPQFFTGGFYHIYNRGVEKRNIFLGRWDFLRFLETLDYYRKIPLSAKLSDFRRGKLGIRKTEHQTELVKIYCYSLMPNHYHILIQQLIEGGVTLFLRKISDSYTRYFNTRHERIGPLFQGKFKAKLIESEEYLLYLSKYIHKNTFPLPKWEGRINPYSSYGYYLSGKEHHFCDIQFILSYFSRTNKKLSYQDFVEDGGIDDPRLFDQLIDIDD